jgi:hypothetical protein
MPLAVFFRFPLFFVLKKEENSGRRRDGHGIVVGIQLWVNVKVKNPILCPRGLD